MNLVIELIISVTFFEGTNDTLLTSSLSINCNKKEMSRFKRNDGSVTRKSDFTLVLIIPMGILTTDFKNDTFKCQFRAARHKLGSLRRPRVSVLSPIKRFPTKNLIFKSLKFSDYQSRFGTGYPKD